MLVIGNNLNYSVATFRMMGPVSGQVDYRPTGEPNAGLHRRRQYLYGRYPADKNYVRYAYQCSRAARDAGVDPD